jgi:hypothetical protein
VRIDSRFRATAGSIAGSAAKLLALAPDLVLANANPAAEGADAEFRKEEAGCSRA